MSKTFIKNIEDVKKYVKNKYDGYCFATEYINRLVYLPLGCSKLHDWKAQFRSVLAGRWCPECSNEEKRLGIDYINNFVFEKYGGKCLTNTYINNKQKLDLECKYIHHWQATWTNLSRGKWCPECAGNKKLNIEFARSVVEERGGILLSTEYKNSGSKLTIRCKYNYIFKMSLNAILSKGCWCPHCSLWSSEEICRTYMEQIFDQKFLKVRPDWLLNSNGNKMELDGLSENKINDNYFLAFEHQGKQHYKFGKDISFPNYNETLLLQRQIDDKLKKELCLKNNVILIEFPQLFTLTKINDIKNIIKQHCNQYNILLPQNFETLEIHYNNLYSNDYKLKQIKDLVQSKGGKCLSEKYINSIVKLDNICENNHLFEMSANALRRGAWCSICAGNKKLSLETAQQIAINRGGKCLSTEYINSKTKMLWLCLLCDFIWNAALYSIKNNGSWCPNCAKLKKQNGL